MQQYIYGNIGRAGFKTVSSNRNGFFANHASALSPLMYYDTASIHGKLPKEVHKCFWLLTTNLSIPGGQDYLFLQESGMDVHRNAAIVRGCCSEFSDGNLYDTRFLQLLDVSFGSLKEALQIAELGNLEPLTVDTLPRKQINDEVLDQEILEGILLQLLQKNRVVVRVPSVGAEAMEESRRVLKAIYRRLPYEARKNNGCITGATEKMLDISNAFTFILVDGDTDVTGAMFDQTTRFFDLLHKETIRPVPKNDVGMPRPYVPLLQFLTTQKQEDLDNFFLFCRKSLEGDPEGRYPAITKYYSLLDIYQLGQEPISTSAIRRWAVNLNDASWSKELHDSICEKLAKSIPVPNMLAYLKNTLPQYESLRQVGVLGRADKEKDQKKPRDENAALTLRMLFMLPGYDRVAVKEGMVDHFVLKAKEICPGAEVPTAETLNGMRELWLPEESMPVDEGSLRGWRNSLNHDVCQRLKEWISQTELIYEEEKRTEDAQGQKMIQRWAKSDDELGLLYAEIEVLRLHMDLMPAWNLLIGQCIVDRCLRYEREKPDGLDGYVHLRQELQKMCECYAEKSGRFTDEQERQLAGCDQHWKETLELCNEEITAAVQFRQWLNRLDVSDMAPKLVSEVQQKGANRFLAEIPEGLSLKETKERLKCATDYSYLLNAETICFVPWNIREKPEIIRQNVDMLEYYSNAGNAPNLSSAMLRNWCRKYLSDNKDLMMLLARKDRQAREETLRILANSSAQFAKQDIEALYVYGCPQELLCSKKLSGTSLWRCAVKECFSELPDLPKPLERQPKKSHSADNGLVAIILVLIMLAAAVPGAVLWLFGGGSVMTYGCIVGALMLLAAVALVAAVVQKRKAVKTFLMWLASAMIPGIVTTIAALVLACLGK